MDCDERDDAMDEAVVSALWAASVAADWSAVGWLLGEARWAICKGDCITAATSAAADSRCSLCARLCCAARPFAWCSTERRCASCCLCAVMCLRSLSICCRTATASVLSRSAVERAASTSDRRERTARRHNTE